MVNKGACTSFICCIFLHFVLRPLLNLTPSVHNEWYYCVLIYWHPMTPRKYSFSFQSWLINFYCLLRVRSTEGLKTNFWKKKWFEKEPCICVFAAVFHFTLALNEALAHLLILSDSCFLCFAIYWHPMTPKKYSFLLNYDQQIAGVSLKVYQVLLAKQENPTMSFELIYWCLLLHYRRSISQGRRLGNTLIRRKMRSTQWRRTMCTETEIEGVEGSKNIMAQMDMVRAT